MKFEVVNGQFGFTGKKEEREKVMQAISALLNEIESIGCIEDDECMGKIEITYEYDTDAYTVSDIKQIWREVKKNLNLWELKYK